MQQDFKQLKLLIQQEQQQERLTIQQLKPQQQTFNELIDSLKLILNSNNRNNTRQENFKLIIQQIKDDYKTELSKEYLKRLIDKNRYNSRQISRKIQHFLKTCDLVIYNRVKNTKRWNRSISGEVTKTPYKQTFHFLKDRITAKREQHEREQRARTQFLSCIIEDAFKYVMG